MENVLPPDCYRCTIVRDPVSHFVSLFNQIKRHPEGPHHRGIDGATLTFQGFVSATEDIFIYRAHQSARIIGRRRFHQMSRSQRNFDKLAQELKRLIDEKLEVYDLVGTTEAIDRFYRALCFDNGLDYQPVPRANTAQRHAEKHSDPSLLVRENGISLETKERIAALLEVDGYLYDTVCHWRGRRQPSG